jgi:hypothetical protein
MTSQPDWSALPESLRQSPEILDLRVTTLENQAAQAEAEPDNELLAQVEKLPWQAKVGALGLIAYLKPEWVSHALKLTGF